MLFQMSGASTGNEAADSKLPTHMLMISAESQLRLVTSRSPPFNSARKLDRPRSRPSATNAETLTRANSSALRR